MNVKVSIGELIDKITILKLKIQNISSEEKKKFAQEELNELMSSFNKVKKSTQLPQLDSLYQSLYNVNSILWDLEDEIRKCESNKMFDDKFVLIARLIYKMNDTRFAIKKAINIMTFSDYQEVKQLVSY
jgi:hypothetical protein